MFEVWAAAPAIPRQETLAERIARVSTIRITPYKFVGYIGETQTFTAVGADSTGQVVHGVRFSWETSNQDKIQIDEAGRATFLQPGLVHIICRAGSAEARAFVLVRPTRRPIQTDLEWRLDQGSLQDSMIGHLNTDNLLASMLDYLPVAVGPQGGGSANDIGSAAAVSAVGTPPFTPQEQTRLGPVMPQQNFNIGIPVVSLGGRGLAANLTLYYNSNVWGARFDPILNTTVYTFDPIQSWPSPGFTLGFGRIIYYDWQYDPTYTGTYSLMLIDPNGTRHSLGRGPQSNTATYQTSDGTHITYVGSVTGGGTLYYQDGTKVTYGFVNNRLL